jgi:hypothetical protein
LEQANINLEKVGVGHAMVAGGLMWLIYYTVELVCCGSSTKGGKIMKEKFGWAVFFDAGSLILLDFPPQEYFGSL